MVTREAIVEQALAWLGVPFRHQGRDREGIDCAGLLLVTGWPLGCWPAEFDERNYEAATPVRHMLALLDAHCVRRPAGTPPQLADIVVVLPRPRGSGHCGIVVRPGVMLHASNQIGRVVEHDVSNLFRHPRAVYAFPRVS